MEVIIKDIKKNGQGKVKVFGVLVDDAVYPLLTKPPDAKTRDMKKKVLITLYKAWEHGVSDHCLRGFTCNKFCSFHEMDPCSWHVDMKRTRNVRCFTCNIHEGNM